MITEENVADLFDRANPVPDVEGLDIETLGASRHLEVLEARSGEVTERQTQQPERGPEKKSVLPWLAAALVVVVVGVGILFLSRGDDGQVTSADIETVESLLAAWNSHDGEAVASHFTAGAVFDATIHGPFTEPWVGREEIAERSAGYSVSQNYESAFDYTQDGDQVLFNLRVFDTDFGSVERPRAVAVVISNGLIESFIIETDFIYYCMGDTTSRCKVRETGEVKPTE